MNNKPKRGSSWIWVICVLLFLLLAGGAYYLVSSHLPLLSGSGQDKPQAVSSKKDDDQQALLFSCKHPSFENGACTVCGWKCTEHEFNNGACMICGTPCPHEFHDSVCSICGFKCPHESWNDGACAVCGTPCSHPGHDPETALCVVCGQKQYHHYVRGVCTDCGGKPVFYTDPLPLSFYEPVEHKGTITKHEYTTTLWGAHDRDSIDKAFNVYLPYGYDESQPYDVLILIHGGGGSEDSWLVDKVPYGETEVTGGSLLDYMIEQKVCKPCIVVTPVTNTRFLTGVEGGIYQMREELRDYILPYIMEHYSTYATDSSLDAISTAREHFGLGGLSNGARCVFEAGFQYNFTLFGSYAAFSGDYEPWNTASAIRNGEFAELPITCFFAGAGSIDDFQQQNSKIGFEYIVENTDRLIEGENAFYVDVNGGHDWTVWFTDLYNAMQVMFPD